MTTVETEWLLDVFVPGRPAAQGSKRALGPGRMVESSKYVGPWRERVTYTAMQARTGAVIDRLTPVRLVLLFVTPRPTSAPKRSTPPAIRQPDLDKCVRAVGDALTGVIYADDAQVTEIFASKRIAEPGENSGCRIRVGVAV